MKKTVIYWLTGLSGSGKSTIARVFKNNLELNGCSVRIIDGDDVRASVHTDLDFSPEGIKENNKRVVALCKKYSGQYDYLIVSVITPFEESREYARSELNGQYVSVYVKVSLDTVINRDVKGLYKKALSGEISNFIGVSSQTPYEEPKNPDIVLDTEKGCPWMCVTELIKDRNHRLNRLDYVPKRSSKWYVDKGMKLVTHPDILLQRTSYAMKRFIDDFRYRFGAYNYPHRILFLSGLAMSGTTWMKNLLARIPGVYTRPAPIPEDIRYRQDICDSAFCKTPRFGNTLFKTHMNPTQENFDCLMRNGVEKIVITYRDLRDVAVSRYYRLVELPKPKEAFDYIDYQGLGREKALNHSIETVADFFSWWLRGWFDFAQRHPGVCHFVRYEDLRKDTKGEFQKVLDFYGIKLSDEKVDDIVQSASGKGRMKENMKRAQIQPWALSTNFRSGKVGSWKDEMTAEQKILAKKLLGEELIRLGYEKDLNWAT